MQSNAPQNIKHVLSNTAFARLGCVCGRRAKQRTISTKQYQAYPLTLHLHLASAYNRLASLVGKELSSGRKGEDCHPYKSICLGVGYNYQDGTANRLQRHLVCCLKCMCRCKKHETGYDDPRLCQMFLDRQLKGRNPCTSLVNRLEP